MPTVTRHESVLVSNRTLTLPNSFEVEVCLTGDSVLEKGGEDEVLLGAPIVHKGGEDEVLQPNGDVQNPN